MCLFSTIDGWPISIEVIPAINSNNFSNKPFGSAMAIELAVATQYYSEGMKTHDWGMIKLSEHIGYESGYIGVKFMTRNMANQNVSTAGYPGDINNIENNIDGIYTDDTFYQYWVSDIITADSTENASPATYRRLKYEMDTFGGQSGSPIIYNNKCIGIHNGYSLNDDLNYAFGITSQLYSFILAYK